MVLCGACAPAVAGAGVGVCTEGVAAVGSTARARFTCNRRIATKHAAEKLRPVKGTGFSPYIDPAKPMWALAPEGRVSGISRSIPPLTAACKACTPLAECILKDFTWR